MPKIILTETALDADRLPSADVQIVPVTGKTIRRFDGNRDVVAVVGCRATANRVLSMHLPALSLYQLTSAGFDGIPVEDFAARGVSLCNAGDVYSVPIAETVIYGMLRYAKRYWKNPKRYGLRPLRHYAYIGELASKKLLVMGCGRIGTAVATRAAAFDMTVCGYDCCGNKPAYAAMYTTRADLLAHIADFDYIVTTLPLMEETRHFIDADLIAAMKPSAVIINIGRRGIFDEKALYAALKHRRIGGAVLDMFEKVPNPITNPFRRLGNVIVMPGVSAISQETRARLCDHVTQNCARMLVGEPPVNRIT